MIGHDNDVQDLGWSHDSSILVSVGLDSKVVVWSGYTFEKLKTLASHQSHVKGIAFDPANKYFATASDDRSIKIWRFQSPGPNSGPHDQGNNFILEQTVTNPFKASPLTTYFRRCSWSPDGMHVAAANAVNGPVSSVAIINRGTWDGDIHLIGHEGPVEACAFSPRLFANHVPGGTSKDGRPPSIHTVIACAGQDKALTVWITTNPRPLVIIKDICKKSVSDLAWTPDGKTLFAACLDGSVVMVCFQKEELGWESGLEENERSLAKFGAGRKGAGIIEGTDSLILEERSKQGEMRGAEGRMGALMGDSSHVPSVVNGVPPITNGVNGTSTVTNGHPEPPMTETPKTLKDDTNAAIHERIKSKVTIGKDGRKRVAPILVSSAGSSESSLPRPQLMSSKAGQSTQNDQPQSILDLSKPFDALPVGGLAGLLLGNKRRYAPTTGAEDGVDHVDKKLAAARQSGSLPIISNTPEGLSFTKSTAAPSGQQPTPEFIRPAVANPSLTVSQVRLAVPKVRSHIVRNLGGPNNAIIDKNAGNGQEAGAEKEAMMEARNPPPSARPQDQEPCRVIVTMRGQPIFTDYLPRNALLMTGSKDFWAIGCEDGSVYAWTPVGRRLLNAMVLESQPVVLECQNKWLLCISAVGVCYVWDMDTLSSPHPPVSLAPILDIAMHALQDHPTKSPAVTGARLNSEGRIVVTLTNGEGYAYNPTMYVWQRLSDIWWMVGSQYWNSTDSSVGNLKSNSALGVGSTVSAGVIPYLERSTTNATLARGRAGFLNRLVRQLISREGFEGFESSVSVAHLENRVAAAMTLGAKDDFQVYLYMYAKRIGAEGLKLKVEELLRGLLGGFYEDELEQRNKDGTLSGKKADDRHWGPDSRTLCGWPRMELLKGVILILGKSSLSS